MTAPKKYRRRYLVFSASEKAKKRENNIFHEVRKKLREFPYSRILFYNKKKNKGLIKCDHLQLDEIKESLEGERFSVLGVSGTIKGATKKFISK